MKPIATYRRGAQALGAGGLLLALVLAAGCGHKAAPPPATAAKPKAAAAKTNSVVALANSTNEDDSVFDDTLLAPKGRDPFFPDSSRRNPKPVVAAGAQIHAAPVLVLKAIISAGKESEAMVNNAMLQVGEEPQVVHIHPGGQVKVRCLEIGDNYVVIQVEGEAEPKRLVIEQKKGLLIK